MSQQEPAVSRSHVSASKPRRSSTAVGYVTEVLVPSLSLAAAASPRRGGARFCRWAWQGYAPSILVVCLLGPAGAHVAL